MNPNVPVMIIVVFVSAPVRRDPPSSSVFPAAPVIDTTAEPASEPAPLAKVIPLHQVVRRVG